jgi:hypothetical protein
LERLLASGGLDVLELCRGKYGGVADIGAADGDLAFFSWRTWFVGKRRTMPPFYLAYDGETINAEFTLVVFFGSQRILHSRIAIEPLASI